MVDESKYLCEKYKSHNRVIFATWDISVKDYYVHFTTNVTKGRYMGFQIEYAMNDILVIR